MQVLGPVLMTSGMLVLMNSGMLVLIFCCHLMGVCVCALWLAYVSGVLQSMWGWLFGDNRLNLSQTE